GMSGLFVYPAYRLLRRPGRQAERRAGLGVEPGVLEVHALGGLDRQVALAGLAQLVLGYADEPAVHVHELRHATLLTVSDGNDFSLPLRTAVIHRSGDLIGR